MTIAAVLMMVVTMGIVTGFSVYFFYKVLRTPPKEGSDTYTQQKS